MRARLRLIGINVLVFAGLLVGLEGLASIVLVVANKGRGVAPSGNVVRQADPEYKDPYTGKMVTQTGVGNYYLGMRYAPFSLAEFYWENESDVSPLGLYTDKYGFIHNGDPYRDLSKGLSGKRIIMFGGSSMAGGNSTSRNDRNIAAFVEKDLNAMSGRENQVVNAGVGGYESFRELIYAQQLVGEVDADTWIFFDGRNDWFRLSAVEPFARNYVPESVELFRQRQQMLPAPESSAINDHLALGRLRKLIAVSLQKLGTKGAPAPQGPRMTAYLDIKGQRYPKDGFTLKSEDIFAKNSLGFAYTRTIAFRPEAVKNYVDNLRSIAGLCIAHKKRCIIALQPVPGFGNRKLHPKEETYLSLLPFNNYREAQNAFFAAAAQRAAQTIQFKDSGVEFLDLTGLFDGDEHRIFLDSIHYLDYANCLIGAAFAEHVHNGNWREFRKHRNACLPLASDK